MWSMTTIPGVQKRALMMSETERAGVVGYKRPPSDTRFGPGAAAIPPAGRSGG